MNRPVGVTINPAIVLVRPVSSRCYGRCSGCRVWPAGIVRRNRGIIIRHYSRANGIWPVSVAVRPAAVIISRGIIIGDHSRVNRIRLVLVAVMPTVIVISRGVSFCRIIWAWPVNPYNIAILRLRVTCCLSQF